MGRVTKSLSVGLSALWIGMTSASAQIAPGVRSPENLSEAIMMVHLLGCVPAATGRPANGLNMPLHEGAAGIFVREELPERLRAGLDDVSDQVRLLELTSPEGSAWAVFDRQSSRCLVTAWHPQPASIKKEVAGKMEAIGLPRIGSPAIEAKDGTALPVFDWQIDGTPRLGTPAVHLRVIVDARGTKPGQIIVTSQAIPKV